MLVKAAAGLGHVDVELDPDGIARSVYLKAGLGSPYWSTLSLAMLEFSKPDSWQVLPGQRYDETGQPSPYLWVRDQRILIPFVGPPGHFKQVSYLDVLRNDFPPATFRNKFVLVGVTASGLGDTLPTPVSGLQEPMSGVEFNANVLNALQDDLVIRPVGTFWRLLLTASLVLLSVLLYSTVPAQWTLSIAGLLIGLTAASTIVLLHGLHQWFPPAPALLVLSLSYPVWAWRRLQDTVRSLFMEKERAQITLRSIGDAVIVTDAEGVVEYMNPIAETLTGFPLDEARGRPLGTVFRILDEPDRTPKENPIILCLTDGRVIKFSEDNSTLISRTGEEYAIRASAAPIRDQGGAVLGAVLAIHDITEARQLAQQIIYQANHDVLTQLPNRNLLQSWLQHAIAHAHRTGKDFAILFLDLDRFKTVNDSLGHSAGDTLLRAMAARLQASRRAEDIIVRLGGDEFVIVLEDLLREEWVAVVARKILKILEPPFFIGGQEFFLTGSIGISLFPRDGEDAETLLKNADTAMYRAKETGGNNIQFYAKDMNLRVVERLKMEQDLRYALERQELELHYQPQADLKNGRIVGVEALLRWEHPQHGLISPGKFVPLAEETGLIVPIGEWVLRTACEQAKAWQARGLPALRVAVNLSPRQFIQQDMTDMVLNILRETGLEARCLDLEITESLIMQDVDRGIAILRALKSLGLRLSIDDFGTGYSSLNYLKRFPIDQLKIDRSFVHDITTNQDDAAIALAVIAMAHSMKLRVIAEGVETGGQLAFLRLNRCDEMQGYYLSRPLPAQEITAFLEANPSLPIRQSKEQLER